MDQNISAQQQQPQVIPPNHQKRLVVILVALIILAIGATAFLLRNAPLLLNTSHLFSSKDDANSLSQEIQRQKKYAFFYSDDNGITGVTIDGTKTILAKNESLQGISPGGSYLVTKDQKNTYQLRDVNGKELPPLDSLAQAYGGAYGIFARDEKLILTVKAQRNQLSATAPRNVILTSLPAVTRYLEFTPPKDKLLDAVLGDGSILEHTILDFADRKDGSSVEMFLFHPKTNTTETLGRFNLENIFGHELSPDTTMFAYATYSPSLDAQHELRVFDLKTKQTRTLIPSVHRNLSSADSWHWSPDGKTIVADVATKDEEAKMVLVDVATGTVTQLPAISTASLLPKTGGERDRRIVGILPVAWSPDGKGFIIKSEGNINYTNGRVQDLDEKWYYNIEDGKITPLDFLNGKRDVAYANQ